MAQGQVLVNQIVGGVIALIVLVAFTVIGLACFVVLIQHQQRKRVQTQPEDSQYSSTSSSRRDTDEVLNHQDRESTSGGVSLKQSSTHHSSEKWSTSGRGSIPASTRITSSVYDHASENLMSAQERSTKGTVSKTGSSTENESTSAITSSHVESASKLGSSQASQGRSQNLSASHSDEDSDSAKLWEIESFSKSSKPSLRRDESTSESLDSHKRMWCDSFTKSDMTSKAGSTREESAFGTRLEGETNITESSAGQGTSSKTTSTKYTEAESSTAETSTGRRLYESGSSSSGDNFSSSVSSVGKGASI